MCHDQIQHSEDECGTGGHGMVKHSMDIASVGKVQKSAPLASLLPVPLLLVARPQCARRRIERNIEVPKGTSRCRQQTTLQQRLQRSARVRLDQPQCSTRWLQQ